MIDSYLLLKICVHNLFFMLNGHIILLGLWYVFSHFILTVRDLFFPRIKIKKEERNLKDMHVGELDDCLCNVDTRHFSYISWLRSFFLKSFFFKKRKRFPSHIKCLSEQLEGQCGSIMPCCNFWGVRFLMLNCTNLSMLLDRGT